MFTKNNASNRRSTKVNLWTKCASFENVGLSTFNVEYTDFQVPKNIEDKKTRAMFSMLRWSVLQEQNKNQFLPTYHVISHFHIPFLQLLILENIPKPAKVIHWRIIQKSRNVDQNSDNHIVIDCDFHKNSKLAKKVST